MHTYKIRYVAGCGEQSARGFSSSIYIEENVDYRSDKPYFDYVDFFKSHVKPDDTYFHIAWLENRALNEKEIQSRNEYRKLRDAHCEKAKQEFIKTHQERVHDEDKIDDVLNTHA